MSTSSPHPHIHPPKQQTFGKEILLNAVFVLGFLVLPEVLAVNRRPAHWAWLALLPLLAYRLPDQGRLRDRYDIGWGQGVTEHA